MARGRRGRPWPPLGASRLLIGLGSAGCARPVDEASWFVEVEVTDRSLILDDHRAGRIEARVGPTEETPSRQTCPVGALSGARFNGELASFATHGTYESGLGGVACLSPRHRWTFVAPPDSGVLDLGPHGTFTLDVPFHTFTREVPADGVVDSVVDLGDLGDPIIVGVSPPLADDAELKVFGYSRVRDPWPVRGCRSGAGIEDGAIVGVADAFDDARAAGEDPGVCAAQVQEVHAPVDLAGCELAQRSFNEARTHIAVLAIAPGALAPG